MYTYKKFHKFHKIYACIFPYIIFEISKIVFIVQNICFNDEIFKNMTWYLDWLCLETEKEIN